MSILHFNLIQVAEAQQNTEYMPTLLRKKVVTYEGKSINLHSGFLEQSDFWLKSSICSNAYAGAEKLPVSFSRQLSHYNATSMHSFRTHVTQRRGLQSFASMFVWLIKAVLVSVF